MNNRIASWLCALLLSSILGCHDMHEVSTAVAMQVVEQTFQNTIGIPAVLDASQASFSATASNFSVNGISLNSLGYGGAGILGPTLKIEQGTTMNLAFTNQLTEPTNIHWHGLEAPANQDGYPTDLTQPGGVFTYAFPVNDRAGTYWYHPHPDMATASQAYRGLAGLFIVTSPAERALNLPDGAKDIPLVIQDKRLSGGLTYNPNIDDQTIGYFGESILVNGTAGALLDVSTSVYRMRVLNGSNARMYNLGWSNNMKFKLIGTDGGLVDAPIELSSMILAPGERAEILVDFGGMATGSEVFLQSAMFSGSSAQGKQAFKIMKCKIGQEVKDNFVAPTTLMPVQAIAPSAAVATRSFNIGHMMDHGGMNGAVMHPLDGKIFDANRRDEVVKAGTVEIWEFDNSTGTEIHPMHLHGLQFQVIQRSGGRGTVEPWEKGWKDTVVAMPQEKVRIIVRFPNNKGKFVFHCHNLEHEDAGMMLNFEIQ